MLHRVLILWIVILSQFSWGVCSVHNNRQTASFAPFSSTFRRRRRRRAEHAVLTTIKSSHSTNGGDETHMQQNNDDDNNDDDDEEDDRGDTAYRNRSLAWTRKYRQLITYEYARRCAMELGLRCQDDWDDYWTDGKVYHGPYLVSRPDEMYPDDWISWDEFLGVMRPYTEARQLVRQVLQFQTPQQYQDFVHANPKRAEGLRIPAQPHIVYRDKGWTSWQDFLQHTNNNNDDGVDDGDNHESSSSL